MRTPCPHGSWEFATFYTLSPDVVSRLTETQGISSCILSVFEGIIPFSHGDGF